MPRKKTKKKPTQTELRQVRAKVRKAKMEMKKAKRKAEKGIEASIGNFSAVVKNTEKKILKLTDTGEEAWKELKKDVIATWKDLKHFAKKATSQLKI